MTFDEALDDLGFGLLQRRRNGDAVYTKRSNPYLTWTVVVHAQGRAQLSWEFELGAYLKAKGLAASVQDELSLMVFPGDEVRGPAEASWLRGAIAGAAHELESVDLLTGT